MVTDQNSDFPIPVRITFPIQTMRLNDRRHCIQNCVEIRRNTGTVIKDIRELKQATFLTTRTSTGSKFDVISQSRFLALSFDVTRAVRVVKNVGCLSSLLLRNRTE